MCPIKYGATCYWVELRHLTHCSEIPTICRDHGGEPAVVYSEKHYNMIGEHIRSLLLLFSSDDHQHYIDFWLDWAYHRRVSCQTLAIYFYQSESKNIDLIYIELLLEL